MNSLRPDPEKSDPPFPHGAKWLRADFHLHTKADQEFQYEGEAGSYAGSYVDALEKADIRLGVITNHNKFDHDEFKKLRSAAKKRHRPAARRGAFRQ